MPKDYDSTVARIAGNLLSGVLPDLLSGVLPESEYEDIGINNAVTPERYGKIIAGAVLVARSIVTETRRTEVVPSVRPEIDKLFCKTDAQFAGPLAQGPYEK